MFSVSSLSLYSGQVGTTTRLPQSQRSRQATSRFIQFLCRGRYQSYLKIESIGPERHLAKPLYQIQRYPSVYACEKRGSPVVI